MDNEFTQILDHFQETNSGFLSPPRICMITSVATLDIKSINIDEITDNSRFIVREQRNKKSRNHKRYRSFYNSKTLVFEQKKTIKVFRNGRLHITGCTSVTQAMMMITDFIATLSNNETIKLVDYKILTYNVTFAFTPKTFIDLTRFHQTLQKEKIQSRYTPDIYQGLIIKHLCEQTNKQLSFLCFYTGTFIATAITNPNELSYALEFLPNLLRKHQKAIEQ
jgi:TATA-box binding protein (TBP) (component of TFIID and TFIIIB)